MIKRFVERYRSWRERRFLKNHGCKTRQEYNRLYDPDYNIRATRIADYYHGYPYVYCFEDGHHFAYAHIADYGPGGIRWGFHDINDWCSENLSDKFRIDAHRVIKSFGGEWEINDIGGGDYIFIAFKSETDYLHFRLRW